MRTIRVAYVTAVYTTAKVGFHLEIKSRNTELNDTAHNVKEGFKSGMWCVQDCLSNKCFCLTPPLFCSIEFVDVKTQLP